jgi:Threonine dehydrogenase and related Zn-dependent dehydrogenases
MTDTMKAAIFDGPGKLSLKDVPIPRPGPGEMLLKIGSNTVCGTDVRILRGEKTAGIDKGVILGHEISGYVEDIGPGVTNFSKGDLVGIVPSVACGYCEYCQRGVENLCLNARIFGYAIDGGLAEYILIPSFVVERGGAIKADPTLSAVEVSLAEPLGCVLNGARNYHLNPGETALILGAGPIGLLHLQVAKLSGASQIIMSDPSPIRRQKAEQLGATHVVDPAATDVTEYVRHETQGLGADVAIVCIGKGPLLSQAMSCVRKRGRVSAFAGFEKGSTTAIDPNLIHYGELEIVGASNASRYDHGRALRLISEGKVNVKELHTHTFPLTEVIEAIEFSASGEGIKVAVVPKL